MNTKTTTLIALLAASALGGCQYHARSPEEYQKVTYETLEQNSPQLKGCYDEVLKQDKNAGGLVVVKFTVEAETGELKEAVVDAEKTTAPEALSECVLEAVAGLKIDPPDARDGIVTWSYDFKANPQKQL